MRSRRNHPRPLKPTPSQRANWGVAGGGYGIYWEEIDEDISTAGTLCGTPSPNFK